MARKKSLKERLAHERSARAAKTRQRQRGSREALPTVPVEETRINIEREEFGYTLGALISGTQPPESQEEAEFLRRVLHALETFHGDDIQLVVDTGILTEDADIDRSYVRVLRWSWTRQDVGAALYSAINATREWAYKEFGEMANLTLLVRGISIARLVASAGDRALSGLTEKERRDAEEETRKLEEHIADEERREKRKRSRRRRESKLAKEALKEKRAKKKKKPAMKK